MTYMPIQLPPGIVRGANPDDAPGRWYDGNLIRWRDGVMEPVGGWSKVTTAALGSTARLIHQWKANNSLTMTLIGCDQHLYADNSGTCTAPAGTWRLMGLAGTGVSGSPTLWLRIS